MSDSKNSDSQNERIGLLNEKQSKILLYIDSKIDNIGYIKSKEVAKNIQNVSSKEVGSNMPIISRESEKFDIEEWSTSASNTWKVNRK